MKFIAIIIISIAITSIQAFAERNLELEIKRVLFLKKAIDQVTSNQAPLLNLKKSLSESDAKKMDQVVNRLIHQKSFFRIKTFLNQVQFLDFDNHVSFSLEFSTAKENTLLVNGSFEIPYDPKNIWNSLEDFYKSDHGKVSGLMKLLLGKSFASTSPVEGLDDGMQVGTYLLSAAGEAMQFTSDLSGYAGSFKIALSSLQNGSCESTKPLFSIDGIDYWDRGTATAEMSSPKDKSVTYKMSYERTAAGNKTLEAINDEMTSHCVKVKRDFERIHDFERITADTKEYRKILADIDEKMKVCKIPAAERIRVKSTFLKPVFSKCTNSSCVKISETEFLDWYHKGSKAYQQRKLMHQKKLEAEISLRSLAQPPKTESDKRKVNELKYQISQYEYIFSMNPDITFLEDVAGATSVAKSLSRCCTDIKCGINLREIMAEYNSNKNNFASDPNKRRPLSKVEAKAAK